MNLDWILVCFVFFPPLFGLFLLALEFWLPKTSQETRIVWISRITFLISMVAAFLLAIRIGIPGEVRVFRWATWFGSGDHTFALSFLVDRLSAIMVLLTTVLCSLIGHFSVTYLHAERGFFRFFLLLQSFAVGMLVLFLAEHVELLFVGWEFVGLSSVLLIMFFHERNTPVRHGIHTFVVYRVCDLGLLAGMVLLHHFAHTASFQHQILPGHWMSGVPHLTASQATWVGLLFILAAIGKSAQFPVGNWLPRAMEGPTPSSAIFYGGLSVHAGVYLLLRASPLFEDSVWASLCLIGIGATTAVFATLMGRMQTDIKNALAYATMTQVGLMFIEIGLHWETIATLHLVGHACLRTWQFLRSPSILQDLHQLKGTLDQEFIPGRYLENIEQQLPGQIGAKLYMHALHRFYWENLLQRWLIEPVLRLARRLAQMEQRWFVDPRPPVAVQQDTQKEE